MRKWITTSSAVLKNNSKQIFIIVFSLLVIFRIWLVTGIPKMLIYGSHDDLFFAKAAHYMINGQWMGPYTQMTLIKGPFYVFFLCFSFFTGLPLLLNETIFYLAACCVLYVALKPLINNYWVRLFVFIAVLFCPASLPNWENISVYREFVYFSLTLYVVAFSIGLFLRISHKTGSLLFWSIGLGVSMGAFLLTREEGVWIYPVLFILIISCIVFIWTEKIDHKVIRTGFILLPILIWFIPSLIVSSLNNYRYNYFGTVETLDPDINRVLATLESINENTWHPAIQISTESLTKAYAVSPLLLKLENSIENSWSGWDFADNSAMEQKPLWYLDKYTNGGPEIGNGHFVWLLRDAVYNSDQFPPGKFPRQFYKQLADQLESACNNGKLSCSPKGSIPFVGSIDKRHFPIITRMFYENFIYLLVGDLFGTVNVDTRSWPLWPQGNNEYRYFDELVYNSLDRRTDFTGGDKVQLTNGETDLRLKMTNLKEKLMQKIFFAYRTTTCPVFTISFLSWFLLLVLLISKKQMKSRIEYLVISLFLIGLLLSRLIVLTIVDATTSVRGIDYGASMYLFVYLFSFLLMYWVFIQYQTSLKNIIYRNKHQTGGII